MITKLRDNIWRRMLLGTVLGHIGPIAFSLAQSSSLNVADFGARGDAVQLLAGTVSNSANITVQSTNRLSEADVGKLVLLSGAGPYTTPTNNQDLVATILEVSNGTNATISMAAGATSNSVSAVVGTQNAQAFQRCVDACSGTNTVVQIPTGHYLLLSPQAMDAGSVMQTWADTHPAVTIQKGGIHFLGTDRDSTVLLGIRLRRLAPERHLCLSRLPLRVSGSSD